MSIIFRTLLVIVALVCVLLALASIGHGKCCFSGKTAITLLDNNGARVAIVRFDHSRFYAASTMPLEVSTPHVTQYVGAGDAAFCETGTEETWYQTIWTALPDAARPLFTESEINELGICFEPKTEQ